MANKDKYSKRKIENDADNLEEKKSKKRKIAEEEEPSTSESLTELKGPLALGSGTGEIKKKDKKEKKHKREKNPADKSGNGVLDEAKVIPVGPDGETETATLPEVNYSKKDRKDKKRKRDVDPDGVEQQDVGGNEVRVLQSASKVNALEGKKSRKSEKAKDKGHMLTEFKSSSTAGVIVETDGAVLPPITTTPISNPDVTALPAAEAAGKRANGAANGAKENKRSKKEKRRSKADANPLEMVTENPESVDPAQSEASNGIIVNVDPPVTAGDSTPAADSIDAAENNVQDDGDAAMNELAKTYSTKNQRFIVFIGNLPFATSEEQLREHFAAVKPQGIRHITDKNDPAKKSKGFAFLEFENFDRMKTCLKLYHHSIFPRAPGAPRSGENEEQQLQPHQRRINVELTAGGGGAKSQHRKAKVAEKNARLTEQRARQAEAREEAKKEVKRKSKVVDETHPAQQNRTKAKKEKGRKKKETVAKLVDHPSKSTGLEKKADDKGPKEDPTPVSGTENVHPDRISRMG